MLVGIYIVCRQKAQLSVELEISFCIELAKGFRRVERLFKKNMRVWALSNKMDRNGLPLFATKKML